MFPFLTTIIVQFFASKSPFFSLPSVHQHSRNLFRLLNTLLRLIQLRTSSPRYFYQTLSCLGSYLLARNTEEDFLLQAFSYYMHSFFTTSPLNTISPLFTGLILKTCSQAPLGRCVFHACDELKMFLILTQVGLISVMSKIATGSDYD